MTEFGLDRGSVRRLLAEWGVRPSKRLGQSFLVDEAAARAVAAAVKEEAPSCVVEIGPGLGSITRFLAQEAVPLTGIEVDRRLAEYLTSLFAERPFVRIVAGDAIEFDLESVAGEHEAGLVVVGSIPYSITAPILKRLVQQRASIRSALLITQREVADKIAASPGKDGSALGIYVQSYAEVKMLRAVRRGAFYPVPEVDSTLWRLRFHGERRFRADESTFFAVVGAIYGARRKTLRNALGAVLDVGEAAAALDRAGLDGSIRGETLGFADLDKLSFSVESAIVRGKRGGWRGGEGTTDDKRTCEASSGVDESP